RPGDGFSRAERPRSAAQERFRAGEIAELRHRDASKRQRRRIVAKRDALQRAEGIARREGARCGCDQGVHRNPATLVTPTIRCRAFNLSQERQRPRAEAWSNEGERTMTTKHATGTRSEWLTARLDLLEAEKELTRRGDEVARRRQELPWVRIDKEYRFDTDKGSASLADLFKGRSQLLVYHFMFGPDYTAGCPSCSSIADGFDGIAVHLANHDVMLTAVSRAPLAKLQEYQRRMGWTFPWASSFGSDFNSDFSVGFTREQQREGGIEYNFRREKAWEWRPG